MGCTQSSADGRTNVDRLVQRNQADTGVDGPVVAPPPIRRIGIVGAGVMGCAIAAANLARRLPVTIADADAAALARSTESILQQVVPEESADVVASRAAVAPLLRVDTAADAFAECDLVLESIVETLEVKRTVLRRIEPQCRVDALLASNTSTIPITRLAEALAHPERFCGIHFCNPVRHRRLVEVVRGRATCDAAVVTAMAYAKSLGKLPIVVRDSPGFLVNRILFPYLSVSLELLGVGATAEQIERVALGFGMELGPLGLYDLIGIDTAFYAGRSMWDTFRDRIVPSPILPALLKAGRLGRKKNVGFYVYDASMQAPQLDEGLRKLVEPYVRHRRSFSDEELIVRLFVPMLLEATRTIEEGLVRDPRDVDVAAIFGLGFPPAKGGLLYWADGVGAANILRMLEPLSALGPRAAPTQLLIDMAHSGARFY